MKAAIYTAFGPPDVVRIAEVEKPSPKEDEVLLQVRAASVNPLDWRLMRGVPLPMRVMFGTGVRRPKDPRLGHDVAGQVEAVGRRVTRFRPGDEVFGTCPGAFAEYACAPESKLAAKPQNASFEQAASLPVAAISALQGLRDKGRLHAGQKVLINGAAGGMGTFAVQIAKSLGAEVTGVCSTRNLEQARTLGADRVIDYTREDFTRSGERYDLILDNVGNRSLSDCRRALNPKGALVIAGAPKNPGIFLLRAIAAPVLSWFVGQRLTVFFANINSKDLGVLREMVEAGKLTPVIDRRYRLEEVAEALRYVEEGHARSKVVIAVGAAEATRS